MSAHPERQVEMGQDSRQIPQGSGPDAGQVESGALAEDTGPEMTIAHVRGAEAVSGWKHNAYTLIGGGLDGRHRLERAVRRLCEEISRDLGFPSFEAMPATQRGLTRRYAEMDVAASAMWASALATGRLADRWLDLTSLQRRLGEALGLQRVIKDAGVIDVAKELARMNGEGR